MRTKEDIEDLKRNWQIDPCWDIEETEGFEDHKLELQNFRYIHEQRETDIYNKDLEQYAYKIGTGSTKLAEHIRGMKTTIEELKEEIYRIKHLINN